MASQKVALEVEVQGVEQSIESVKDLKNAIKAARDEQVKAASAFGETSKEYLDATKKVSGLKDKVDDLNDSTKSLKGTGVEQLTIGFSQMKEGIMNLDFDKVKAGMAAMKSGIGAFATSAKTALSGFKGALLATGIGALVVALGVIVAYWDDIKGLVSGVSAEQKKLNELAAENLKAEQDKLTAIGGQENILKLQGKTEKEILQLKIKQTDEAITASDIAIQQAETTKKAQVEASKRNYDILNGIITFISTPIASLLESIDFVGKAFGKNFGLAESFAKSDSIAKLLFDPEQVASEGDKAIAEAKLVNDKLRNDRAGLQLSVNKIDTDAAKLASENKKKKDEEEKKARDEKLAAEIAAMKQIQDAYVANEQDEQKRLVKKAILDQQRRFEEINKTVTDETLKAELLKQSEKTFQNEMAAIYQTGVDKKKAIDEKAAADKKALDAKALADKNAENTAAAELAVLKQGNDLADLTNQLTVKRDIELQNKELTESQKLLIEEKYAQDVEALNKASEAAKFDMAKKGLEGLQSLSDIFFTVKLNKTVKGSKEEEAILKKQFELNKAFQLSMTAVQGIQNGIDAYGAGLKAASVTGIGAATAPIVGAAYAAISGLATLASLAKIKSTKFGGGASGGGGAESVGGGAPSIPPPPTIATPENNTNKTTSFDETGKNLNFQGTPTPTINVKASVGVDEITSKSNRVEVLENQSTF